MFKSVNNIKQNKTKTWLKSKVLRWSYRKKKRSYLTSPSVLCIWGRVWRYHQQNTLVWNTNAPFVQGVHLGEPRKKDWRVGKETKHYLLGYYPFFFLKQSENYGPTTPSLDIWAKARIQELWSFERHLFDPRNSDFKCRARLNMMGTTLLVPASSISMLLRLRMIQIFRICLQKSPVVLSKGSVSQLTSAGSAIMTEPRSLWLFSRTEAGGIS